MTSLTVALPGEVDTAALGARLAAVARTGDAIGLRGELGAGKTTLARGFIQALTSEATEVPSPTFTLVQTYDTAKGPIAHFDLYRLKDAAEVNASGVACNRDAFRIEEMENTRPRGNRQPRTHLPTGLLQKGS